MRTMLVSVAFGAALSALGAPAFAATAHNSQAGSSGPNSHQCAATPYFPAGGCASAALIDDRRYPFTVGAEEPYRPGRRLTYPTGPMPVPTYEGD